MPPPCGVAVGILIVGRKSGKTQAPLLAVFSTCVVVPHPARVLSGGLPFLPLWLRLDLVSIPLFVASVAVCLAVALALAVGFWKYQRWEDRAIKDWSFIQWGEFVAGATLGAIAMTVVAAHGVVLN